jgi:hypothetical protein
MEGFPLVHVEAPVYVNEKILLNQLMDKVGRRL